MGVCTRRFTYLPVLQKRNTLTINTTTVAIRRAYVIFWFHNAMRVFLQDGHSHCFLCNNGLIYWRTLFKRDSKSCFRGTGMRLVYACCTDLKSYLEKEFCDGMDLFSCVRLRH